MTGKNIIFFHYIKEFKKFNETNENFFKKDKNIIIALNPELINYLKRNKINFKVKKDYLDEFLADEVENYSFEIAKNWYKNNFKIFNINLGLTSQLDLKFYYFPRILKNIQLIKNIIINEKPDKIILFQRKDYLCNEFNNTVQFICALEKNQINLNIIDILKYERIDIFKKKKLDLEKYIYTNPGIVFLTVIIRKVFWTLKVLKLKIFHKKRKNILFFQYGNYNNSIIKQAPKRYNIFLYEILNFQMKFILNNLKNIILNRGGYHVSKKEFKSFKLTREANRIFKEKKKEWKILFNNPNFKKNFIFNGIYLWELVKKQIYKIIFHEFKNSILEILIIRKFLNEIKLEIVIFGNDDLKQAITMAIVCSKMNINTLTVQHGAIEHLEFFKPFIEKNAIWGKYIHNLFSKYKNVYDKMIITGCPQFDDYYYLKNKAIQNQIKRDVYKEFNIGMNKKLIILAFSPYIPKYNITSNMYPSEFEKKYDLCLNLLNDISNIFIIIKFHPAEKRMHFLLKNYSRIENLKILKNYEIKKLIAACDCFITSDSTAGIQAMCLKKPLICLKFRKSNYFIPYFKYNVAYKISNYPLLLKSVKRCLNNPDLLKNYDSFLKDYLYKIDGKSTQRILNLIDKIVKSKN